MSAGSDPVEFVELLATPVDAGGRVDRFVAARIGTVSRSRVKQLMESGLVALDGTALFDPSATVRAGGRYTLRRLPPVDATPVPEAIPLTIAFEDADLLVVDKPAGLVTHPAPGHEAGTLVNALLAHCGDGLPGIGGERRPGIVHRLDKDTSGLMVVAKSERALASLSAAIAARAVERAYVALVWNVPQSPGGTWDGPIGRDPRDRKRMAVRAAGGKPALTRWTLRGSGPAVALLSCRLETGRTHQIRVHAAAAGHPLVGDPVYLRRRPAACAQLEPALRDRLLDFPRQALHAATLGFRHPVTSAPMRFAAPLPADLVELFAAAGLANVALQHEP